MAKQDGSYEAISDHEAFTQQLYLTIQGIAQNDVEGFRQRWLAVIRQRDRDPSEDGES